MTRILLLLSFLTTLTACDWGRGEFAEIERRYSPDGSKYILTYQYQQGAWDGERSSLVTILKADETFQDGKGASLSTLDFDTLYWCGNDTIAVAENYTEFLRHGQSFFEPRTVNGVFLKVIQIDPIDNSFQRKIILQQSSPDNNHKLVIYKYSKPGKNDSFLNVSVINPGDSIPKFGNFLLSKYGFDCITDIRWNSENALEISVSESCFYGFNDYLVKNKPDVKFKIHIDNE